MEDEEEQQSTLTEEPQSDAAGEHGVKLQSVVGVLFVAVLLSMALRRLAKSNLVEGMRRWLPVLYTLLWGVTLLGLTVMYARGLSETAFIGVFVLFLLLAFSSVGWLRSVMAGVALSMEGRIHLGDSIRIGETSGEVIDFGVRALRLRAVDGSIHEIPNEKLVTESVANLSGDGGDSAAELLIPVPDGVDPDAAVRIARDVAILTPLASPRHRPEVFLESGGPNGRRYELRVRGYAFDAAFQDHFRSDVVSRIQGELSGKAGVEGDLVLDGQEM